MTARVAHIWRHPIKSLGREALEQVTLTAGKAMPWDRVWAVAHEASSANGSAWAPCHNFVRGAKAPSLQAIEARLNEDTGQVALSHPERPDITLHPERDADVLVEWVRPLIPVQRAAPARVVRVPGRGLTDTDFPSISLHGLSSNRAIGQWLGQTLSPRRWRGNIWFEGLGPWEEFEWVGQRIAVGEAVLEVRERITRCLATTVNPETGRRDADTLRALEEGWGHRDFGVYAVVARSGRVAIGDEVKVI